MIAKTSQAKELGSPLSQLFEPLAESYPDPHKLDFESHLDVLIFSMLADHLALEEAMKAYEGFLSNFVDWNELRISPANEVQEVLKAASEPLELALLIKEFLNRLFYEYHHIGIDFLSELTNSEIKGFFKKSPGVSESSLNLVLNRLKDYPVLPLDSESQRVVSRLGLVDENATSLQRQKALFPKVDPASLLRTSLALREHSRQVCLEEDPLCPKCVIKASCPVGVKRSKKKATAAKKSTKKTAKKTAKKKATAKKSAKKAAKKKTAAKKSAKKAAKKKTPKKSAKKKAQRKG